MKRIVTFIVLGVVGLAWIGEKVSANRMADELARLRQQSDQLSDLRRDRDRLMQRLRTAERRSARKPEESTTIPPKTEGRLKAAGQAGLPLGDWVNVRAWDFRGQATPQATIESALWAAAGGDVAKLRDFSLCRTKLEMRSPRSGMHYRLRLASFIKPLTICLPPSPSGAFLSARLNSCGSIRVVPTTPKRVCSSRIRLIRWLMARRRPR